MRYWIVETDLEEQIVRANDALDAIALSTFATDDITAVRARTCINTPCEDDEDDEDDEDE